MSHKPIVLIVLGMIQNRGCLILYIKKLPYPCNSYVLIHLHIRIKTPSDYIKPYATSWDQSNPINCAIKHTNYPWPYHHFAGNHRHTLWQNLPFFCQIHITGPLIFLGLIPQIWWWAQFIPKIFMLNISIFGFIDLMLHLLQIFPRRIGFGLLLIAVGFLGGIGCRLGKAFNQNSFSFWWSHGRNQFRFFVGETEIHV